MNPMKLFLRNDGESAVKVSWTTAEAAEDDEFSLDEIADVIQPGEELVVDGATAINIDVPEDDDDSDLDDDDDTDEEGEDDDSGEDGDSIDPPDSGFNDSDD